MKKQLLIAGLFASMGASAQIVPSDVASPADIRILNVEIPGIRTGFTEMKIRSAVDENTFSTWYDMNVTVANGVITSTSYSNIDPAKPLDYHTRSTGSKSGNIYTAIVEMMDNDWVIDQKQTAYYDASGKDTLWMMEQYDSDNQEYIPEVRVSVEYTATGAFAGYRIEEYDGADWNEAGYRNINYDNSNKRTSDTTYASFQGVMVPTFITNYFYNGSVIDSMAVMTLSPNGFVLSHAHKIFTGNDGGVDQVRTYEHDASNDSTFINTRADFTGGTPGTGVKNIGSDQVGIYPVPAATELTIAVKDGGNYIARIFDLQGRSLLSQEVSGQSTVDVSSLSNGIYLLTMEGNGSIMQQRIVIAR